MRLVWKRRELGGIRRLTLIDYGNTARNSGWTIVSVRFRRSQPSPWAISTHAHLSPICAKVSSYFECSSLVFSIELGLLTTLIIHALTCFFQNMQQLSSSVRNLRERLTLAAWFTNISAWYHFLLSLAAACCPFSYCCCFLIWRYFLSFSHDRSTSSYWVCSKSLIRWVIHAWSMQPLFQPDFYLQKQQQDHHEKLLERLDQQQLEWRFERQNRRQRRPRPESVWHRVLP